MNLSFFFLSLWSDSREAQGLNQFFLSNAFFRINNKSVTVHLFSIVVG